MQNSVTSFAYLTTTGMCRQICVMTPIPSLNKILSVGMGVVTRGQTNAHMTNLTAAFRNSFANARRKQLFGFKMYKFHMAAKQMFSDSTVHIQTQKPQCAIPTHMPLEAWKLLFTK
jgi:hypothetical protein